MKKTDLAPIEAARIKVAILERDIDTQERYMKYYQDKLLNTKEDLEIAKLELADITTRFPPNPTLPLIFETKR